LTDSGREIGRLRLVTTPGRGGELAVQIALNATVARITPEALQVLVSDWLNDQVNPSFVEGRR
jgi:hypothetical protein